MATDLKALLASPKGKLLAGGVAGTVALALYAKHKAATGPGQTLGTLNSSGSAVIDPTTGLPTATYTGAAQVDTTATDIASNLDPMLVQQSNLLEQILAGLQNPKIPGKPKPTPKPKPKPKPKPPPRHTGPVKPPFKHIRRPITSPRPGRSSTTYTVRRGDTLSGIGASHNLPWQTIYRSNRGVIGSNPNVIKPGQKLRIP